MQITINKKVLIITSTVIAISGGVISGVILHNKHKEEVAKKEAELAFANRPIIEHDNCVMNGLGEGSCSFTNTGKTEGAVCGKIIVHGPGKFEGSKFCSGMVKPLTTNKVDFNEPNVRDLCEPKNYLQSWTDVCEFEFVEDGLGGQQTQDA